MQNRRQWIEKGVHRTWIGEWETVKKKKKEKSKGNKVLNEGSKQAIAWQGREIEEQRERS